MYVFGGLVMVWQACAVDMQLALQVDAMLHGGEQEGITFESIHGQDTAVIRAADLDLDRFLPAAEGSVAPTPASELPLEPERVLLTGANGFLGRFLLLDLLQRVSQRCVAWFHMRTHVSWPRFACEMVVMPQLVCAVCQLLKLKVILVQRIACIH